MIVRVQQRSHAVALGRGIACCRWTAVDTSLPRARRWQRRVGLLHTSFAGRYRGLQVLEPEIELVLIQALGLAPEVVAAELTQHVQQALVVTREPGIVGCLAQICLMLPGLR
jgi:hypothetical protein